ncbi:transposase family protein [uncultured Psychrobacter sp.]|uniref:transposase family protein n=1 Tax=uncultured Psychrobacter sp. TaxID=259303 RepID=UPI0030DC51BD
MMIHWKTGLIVDVQTSKGAIHDFKLYKDTYPDWLPCDTKLLADGGYQGIAKLHNQTFTPFKKPRGGQLLDLCKQANQYLAKFRIMVEHKIGLIKLFKIVAHKYRNRRQRYDLRMRRFAGVVSFELSL